MSRVFVVQGFGSKPDLTNGRLLNLDASYEVIKQAVEEAGHECMRADEIIHSGTIDIPMYEQLLRADLVIADLSTYNVNAAFELGVRYGLRPRATIVVAEEQFKSPFDVNHILIRRYKHLGEDIGTREAKRFKEELKTVIRSVLEEERTDSPVYSLLSKLLPPREAEAAAAALEAVAPPVAVPGIERLAQAKPVSRAAASAIAAARAVAPQGAPVRMHDIASAALEEVAALPGTSAHDWLAKARKAMQQGDFVAARAAWEELRKLNPNDSHVTQQLALAVYKSKQPSTKEALLQAHRILQALSPAVTNDPETLGLWGAIHKRLWDLDGKLEYLSESIAAYERGFNLKQDYYNGINLAFLLDVRALESARAGQRDEAIADAVLARRVRRDVLRYTLPRLDEEVTDEARFWLLATLAEACAGTGDAAEAARWQAEANSLRVSDWMRESQREQCERLAAIQAERARLVSG